LLATFGLSNGRRRPCRLLSIQFTRRPTNQSCNRSHFFLRMISGSRSIITTLPNVWLDTVF
jgi:hypothetical protein